MLAAVVSGVGAWRAWLSYVLCRHEAFYMLNAYAKSEQGDLTAAQARVLGRVVREEFK